MKTEEIIEKFKTYLNSNGRGYGNNYFITSYHNPKDQEEKWYIRFDIRSKSKYIQSFILMSENERKGRVPKYPFYRSFNQQAPNGKDVLPACFVATYGNDEDWHIYSCNCLEHELTNNENVTNYSEAVRRFNRRWNETSGKKQLVMLKILCWFFALCCFASVLFCKTLCIPTSTAFAVSVFGVILTLFPIFAPTIKSMTIGLSGISYCEKEE